MLREVGYRLPAQSALARMATAAPGAQVPRAGNTIRASARAATYVPARPRHRHSSTIRAFTHTATYVPARPHHRRSSTIREFAHTATLGCGDSDTTAVAQSTLLRTRQPHQSRQSAAWHQHNPRVCAHNSAGSSSMMPAVMRYGPHTRTHDNSQRCFPSPSRNTPPMAHDTAVPPPQHVSCMKMRYASWLDWRNVFFSLGAGDRHGRDLQAD